jgi:uncharacterized protein (TIGR02569 family)
VAKALEGRHRRVTLPVDDDGRVQDAAAPPERVLRAFGARGRPVRLPGGQGSSWRAGDRVLKPDADPVEVAWLGEALAPVVEDGFRVARPVAAPDGSWVVDGWSATPWVPGHQGPQGHWRQLLAAARAFHRAVAHVPRPAFLDHRRHRWALADRAAWGEQELPLLPDVEPLAERLRRLLAPVPGPSQVVHGDLSGNLLFQPGRAPAVIDISPYWRPAAYAEAIAVADGLLWWGAGPELLDVAGRAGQPALVARGVLFRLLVEDQGLRGSGAGPDARRTALAPYASVVGLLEGSGAPEESRGAWPGR